MAFEALADPFEIGLLVSPYAGPRDSVRDYRQAVRRV